MPYFFALVMLIGGAAWLIIHLWWLILFSVLAAPILMFLALVIADRSAVSQRTES